MLILNVLEGYSPQSPSESKLCIRYALRRRFGNGCESFDRFLLQIRFALFRPLLRFLHKLVRHACGLVESFRCMRRRANSSSFSRLKTIVLEMSSGMISLNSANISRVKHSRFSHSRTTKSMSHILAKTSTIPTKCLAMTDRFFTRFSTSSPLIRIAFLL